MTYMELHKRVESMRKMADQPMMAGVISDMPLQPWFDLYLQEAWAKLGIRAELQRISWADREKAPSFAFHVVWLSLEAMKEVQSRDLEQFPGVWLSGERWMDPMLSFYGALWTRREPAPKIPAGSRWLDLEAVMAKVGLDRCAAAEERRWGDRYSKALQKEAAFQAVRQWAALHIRRKKCLVLDCDGVLWGNILSEDGMSGILLAETGSGRGFYEFQRLLKRLADHGLLLAICSKNDEENVRQVFQRHTAMALREEDIAAWSVDWTPKSSQIEALARQLNLDPQDFVLIDDNEWEIAEVQSVFPQVAGVLFHPDTIVEELAQWLYLSPEDQNEQNRLRLQTYQDNQRRQELKRRAGSYEEFLQKLHTQIRIQPASLSDLPRISDLSRRANQCTNGTRYTAPQLEELLQRGYQLQAVFVSDCFRDLGLVGCVGICPQTESLDLFCVSCRALGRRLEDRLIESLPKSVHKLRWADTGKNDRLLQQMERQRSWTERIESE